MSPHPQYLLLFLFFLLISSQLISGQIKECPTSTCGDVEIKYSGFLRWFVLETPVLTTYCGYDDLKVTCKDNKTLTFVTSTDSYTVKEINYTDKTISLIDTDVLAQSCPQVRHELDISNISVLGYDPEVVVNLTFFFNCSVANLPPGLPTQSTCLDDLIGKTYVFVGQVKQVDYEWLSAHCSGGDVVSPVLSAGVSNDNVAELFPEKLRDGFQLEWKKSDQRNCKKCEESEGHCGYWNRTGKGLEFTCFCGDGSRRRGHCGDNGGMSKSTKAIIIGIIASILALILLCSLACIMQRKKKQNDHKRHNNSGLDDSGLLINTDFHLMHIATIREATNNFSVANKLGEGGFGSVYKGILQDGKDVAVKRLSSTSTQGSLEFKNEVRLIAKLQHRNLVRLLGCCVEGEEKLLVYEYLPNGSLDTFLFDVNKRSFLDWRTRQHIIFGISRGLLYLHEDSQLKVIHRDLKASNILLDLGMNPKISDFGLARIFSNDENEANTNRVVGTYGYMAPEFAMDGLFSTKSDVYSYGVLLLEIVTGEKNGRSHLMQYEQSLPQRAWQMWKEGKGLELIDPFMVASCSTIEALRCIHVGLLCVQENATDRPTMLMVLHMLRNEHMVLQEPKQPPSFMRTNVSIANHSSLGATKLASINEVTLSDLQAR